MNTQQLDRILAQTLEDERLSRGERKALLRLLEEHSQTDGAPAQLRSRAFALARQRADQIPAEALLLWLEEVTKVSARPSANAAGPGRVAEARFSPGDGCLQKIQELLAQARRSVDICVFTITDDRISQSIQAAHERGVRVRILTDNDKAWDKGSDVQRLGRQGIPVAIDQTEHHMHHKFAVFDGELLLTGSYNWTRSAASSNEENILVTDDERLVRAFSREFEALWEKLHR